MVTFGRKTGDVATGAAGSQHEYFIKTFRDRRTDIRFLWDDPGTEFVEVKEHFDNANKMSYPCANDADGAIEDCVGCVYPVEHPEWTDAKLKNGEIEHPDKPGVFLKDKQDRKKLDPGWGVRDRSSKWIFPAIDPKGYVSIYKIGYKFWQSLKETYELLGTITAQDFAVSKIGETFSDTSYSATAIGQPYPRQPQVTVPTAATISQCLGRNYVYALSKYGYDTTGLQNDEPRPQPVAQAPDPEPVAQEVDPANPGPQAAAQPQEQKQELLPMGDANTRADLFVPKEASVGEIKDFLTDLSVEFPARAARSVLVGLAEQEINKRAGNPPY